MRGLSEGQIERIQRDTEDILQNTGVRVMHEGLVRRAKEAGARVDEASGVVRLPPALLTELLSTAPSQYTIAGAGGDQWTVGGGDRYCVAIVTDPWIIDYASGEPRRPCLEDVRRHTQIAQRLEHVAGISLMDYPVTDVEGPHSNLVAREEHLRQHNKHMYVLPASVESFEQWLRIAQALNQGGELEGSRLMTVGVPVMSPLALTEMNAKLLVRACELDLPVVPTICPMAGSTAPYSKAGVLLQAHIENVFLGALTQLIRRGHPFLYSQGLSRTDMRSGEDQYYTLDKVVWKTAGVQLGKAHGLPTAAECGGSMAARYDLQSGAEGMLFMLSAWESGADLLSGIGSCGNAVTMSGEMMMVHDAWLKAAQFLEKGVDTEAHPGVESIKRVGPGGHFMDDGLTLELLRSDEFFEGELFDYGYPAHVGTSLLERAHEGMEELVAGFECPHPVGVLEGLGQVFLQERGRG